MRAHDMYETDIKPNLIRDMGDQELLDWLGPDIPEDEILELLIAEERFRVLKVIYDGSHIYNREPPSSNQS